MNKIVIFDKKNINHRFLSIRLEGMFNVQVELVHSEVQAIKSLKDYKGHSYLIIKDKDLDKLNLLSHYLKEDVHRTTIYESPHLDYLLDYDCFYIHDLNNFDELFDFLRMKGLEECQFYKTAYTKITLYNFMIFSKAICDYYISLGGDQFLKVMDQGTIISKDSVQEFKKKGTQFLFIKTNDIELFNEQMNQSLIELYASPLLQGKSKDEVHLASIENIKLSLKELGLNEKTLELANATVDHVIDDFKENKNIWSHIQAKDEHEFFSEKTLTISFLCYAIVKELDWKQDKINEKLIMSSLLHDIALEDKELSLVDGPKDIVFKSLSKKEQNTFLQHPTSAAKIINQLQSLPMDVEKIISEHHEKPDGSGFPRGLTSSTIAPLSCIFILADQFCYKLYSGPRDKKTVQFILRDLEDDYSSGNFKGPFKALKSLLA